MIDWINSFSARYLLSDFFYFIFCHDTPEKIESTLLWMASDYPRGGGYSGFSRVAWYIYMCLLIRTHFFFFSCRVLVRKKCFNYAFSLLDDYPPPTPPPQYLWVVELTPPPPTPLCWKRLIGSPAGSPPRHSNEEYQDGVSVRGIPGLCRALPIRLECGRKKHGACVVLHRMFFALLCIVLRGVPVESDDMSATMRNRWIYVRGAFQCVLHGGILRRVSFESNRDIVQGGSPLSSKSVGIIREGKNIDWWWVEVCERHNVQWRTTW